MPQEITINEFLSLSKPIPQKLSVDDFITLAKPQIETTSLDIDQTRTAPIQITQTPEQTIQNITAKEPPIREAEEPYTFDITRRVPDVSVAPIGQPAGIQTAQAPITQEKEQIPSLPHEPTGLLDLAFGILEVAQVPQQLVEKGIFGQNVPSEQMADWFSRSPISKKWGFSPETLTFLFKTATDPLMYPMAYKPAELAKQMYDYAKASKIAITEKNIPQIMEGIRRVDVRLAKGLGELPTEAGMAGLPIPEGRPSVPKPMTFEERLKQTHAEYIAEKDLKQFGKPIPEAPPVAKPTAIAKELEPLAKEARKYYKAEDFVRDAKADKLHSLNNYLLGYDFYNKLIDKKVLAKLTKNNDITIGEIVIDKQIRNILGLDSNPELASVKISLEPLLNRAIGAGASYSPKAGNSPGNIALSNKESISQLFHEIIHAKRDTLNRPLLNKSIEYSKRAEEISAPKFIKYLEKLKWARMNEYLRMVKEDINLTDFHAQATGKVKPTLKAKVMAKPAAITEAEKVVTPPPAVAGGKPPPAKPPAPTVTLPEEQPISKISYDIPEDLGDSYMNKIRGLGARSFAPIREVASRNITAGEIARLGRNSTTALENDLKGVNDIITDTFKGIKTDAQKQELTKLIESGLSKEQVANLPEPYKSAVLGKRKLTQTIEQMAKDEFKIDISQWRYTPEDYMHHLYKGRQKVVNSVTNKTIGFAENRVKSLEMAENYLKTNPSAQISIKPAFDPKQFSATMVSQKGFWKFMSGVAGKLELTPEEVLSELNFKGILAVKPRPKFVGAFKKRIANLEGYLQDPEYVERAVWYKVLRKKHIQPFEKNTTGLLNKLPPNYRKEMESYIKTISSGYDPYAIGGILQEASKWQTVLKLGYRPIAALVNRLQPLQTAFQDVSTKNFIKGFFMKYTDKGKQLLKEIGVIGTPPKYYAGEFGKPLGTQIYKPMGMFSLAEKGTRTDVGLMGYYEMMGKLTKDPELFKTINSNMKQAGLNKFIFKTPHDMAIQFAKDLNSATNFLYTSADTGAWFRNRTFATTLGKFKPFTINYLYNLKNITLGKPLAGLELYYPKGIGIGQGLIRRGKFIGSNVALGGLKVMSFGVERVLSVSFLTYLFINHPIIARGLTGMLGIDLSRNIGIEPFELIPENGWELLGVYGSDIRNIKNAISSGIKEDYEIMGSHLTKISPEVNRIYELLVMDDYLRSPYKRNRAQVELTPTEKVWFGIGAKPLKVGQMEDINRYINITTQQYKDKRTYYIDAIIRAIEDKDIQKRKGLIREAHTDKIFIQPEDIKTEISKKNIPSLLRRVKEVPRIMRPELIKILKENPELINRPKTIQPQELTIDEFIKLAQ